MLAAAEAVAALWRGEFGFEPPALAASRGVSGEADLDRAMHRAEVPVLDVDPERTWLWSDLHLGDRAVLSAWNRPFRDVDDMVVGNSTYAHIGRLANPDSDAVDMSSALRRLGFEVTTELDDDRVSQDHGEAVRWFRRAAEQGHASGQNNLGWMYEAVCAGIASKRSAGILALRTRATRGRRSNSIVFGEP